MVKTTKADSEYGEGSDDPDDQDEGAARYSALSCGTASPLPTQKLRRLRSCTTLTT